MDSEPTEVLNKQHDLQVAVLQAKLESANTSAECWKIHSEALEKRITYIQESAKSQSLKIQLLEIKNLEKDAEIEQLKCQLYEERAMRAEIVQKFNSMEENCKLLQNRCETAEERVVKYKSLENLADILQKMQKNLMESIERFKLKRPACLHQEP